MDAFEAIKVCTGFEWDAHNAVKIWGRHKVTPVECEQMFFNRPLAANEDAKHSDNERRFYALGRTDSGRLLFTVFTVRSNKVRVISARDMSRKERKIYEDFEAQE